MKGRRLLTRLIGLLLCLPSVALAQDFTNQGKDFWLCFPSHVPNERDGVTYYARMSVFITADKNSSGSVSIPGVFYAAFTVTAGQVTEVDVPYHLAHINSSEAGTVIRKGIRVQTDPGKPSVVVYAHIYAGFRSAASLILPVKVLGKKYYSVNAPQVSVQGSKSQFVVMAVDTATTVQITPVRNGVKGTPYTVTLPLPGHLYEVQDDQDLSGSLIESVSPGPDGCKKIAVFSGSSAIHINGGFCSAGESYDPLFQQLYPVHAWGKQYGFIPFQNYTNGNLYRIIAAEDNTQVYLNNFPVALLNAGECYPDHAGFGVPETSAMLVTADKPISMVQYAQSSSCSGANPPAGTGYGDPDMVVLNPVEQQINDITIFSSQKENIFSDSRFINVLIKTAAAPSFTINGVAPATTWHALPGSAVFSYARIQLTGNDQAYTLRADSAFNVIAYGFGDFESYAYSAGTHVKDLYRTLTIENEFGQGETPVGCSGRSFRISVTWPYQPQTIRFRFYGLFPDVVVNNPVPAETFVMNGKTVYRYRLSDEFLINNTGIYPITVIAENSSGLECNAGMDEMDYELEIVNRPAADFTYTHSGCITDAVLFADASNSNGSIFTNWYWDFGDQQFADADSPMHIFSNADKYTIKHWAATNIGCGTDTAKQEIEITGVPVVTIVVSSPVCAGAPVAFSGEAQLNGYGAIAMYHWDFGDQQQTDTASGDPISHVYDETGIYTATLQVSTSSGCRSNGISLPVTVHAVPTASFNVPVFCLPEGSGRFENVSTIAGGVLDDLSAVWDFGDGQSSVEQNPLHRYTDTGPYVVKLQVTSEHGCSDDSSIIVTSVFPQVQPAFTVTPEICLGDLSHITVKTLSADYNGLQSIHWSIDQDGLYEDTVVNGQVNDVFLPAQFATPGAHSVLLYAITMNGCPTDTISAPVFVNELPAAEFEISSPRCEGQPVQFVDRSVAANGSIVHWLWDLGNGSQSTDTSPVAVYPVGQYNVSLVVATDKGCRSAAVIYPVIISPVPVADFDVPEVCVADPFVLFTNQSSIADGSTALLAHQWFFGDPHATPVNPDSAMTLHAQHSYTEPGNYAVQLQVTSSNGCRADTTKTLTVNGARVQAGFVLNEGTPVCSNKPVTLRNTSAVDAGQIIRIEIFWNYARDPLQKMVDEDPQVDEVYSYHYPVLPAPETYHIKYVVYSGIHCLHTIDTLITVHPAPVLIFGELSSICDNAAPVLLNAASEITGIEGTGKYSGTGVVPDGLFNPSVAAPGVHNINYTFTAENGCTATAVQTIRVLASPKVQAGPDRLIPEGSNVQLQGSATGEGLTYQWSPPVYIDSPSAIQPHVWPPATTTYRLTVISSNGCTARDETTITVINKINVPNAFTPNHDGRNDTWKIPYLSLFKNCTVQIFNRWGQRVFHSKGYTQPWDGTLNGNPLPAGTYTYFIDLKNGRPPVKGFVVLIR